MADHEVKQLEFRNRLPVALAYFCLSKKDGTVGSIYSYPIAFRDFCLAKT